MFFERFTELAKAEKTSVNAVAKRLNLSSGSVTAWKNGTEPSLKAVVKIADFFGVTTDYLLNRKPKVTEIPEELHGISVAFSGGAFDGLDEDDIEMLKDMAKVLKNKKQKNKGADE